MTNNIPTGKLDEAVKNTLSNYEAANESPDWSRMERMLDAAPASGSFKWSYVVGVFIGLALVGGGYFIYSSLSTSGKSTTPAVTTAPVPPPAAKPVAAPAVTVTPPAVTTTTPVTSDVPATVSSTPATPANPAAPAESRLKTVVLKEKSKKENTSIPPASPDEGVIIHQRVMGMGDDPVFGDMIDPSKGIVGETKEKDETKKAAVSKKPPVAWDAIMFPNVNPDSLRKYRERHDSTKVEQ